MAELLALGDYLTGPHECVDQPIADGATTVTITVDRVGWPVNADLMIDASVIIGEDEIPIGRFASNGGAIYAFDTLGNPKAVGTNATLSIPPGVDRLLRTIMTNTAALSTRLTVA